MSAYPPANGSRPWVAFLWTVPTVLWQPYQQHAGWLEWLATSLTLGVVLAIVVAGMACLGGQGQKAQDTAQDKAHQRRFAAGVCAALLCIAAGFLAYRPSGGIYFGVAAVFVPAVVGLRGRLMGTLCALAALLGLEWWLLYPDGAQGALLPAIFLASIFINGLAAANSIEQRAASWRLDTMLERERIARDLHDVMGQSLSTLAFKAELARRVLRADPDRALAEISDVERIARLGLEDMREAINGYFAGDVHAELDRGASLLAAAGMRVERRCEPLTMPPANERVLALIAREAITNILRHSQARACRLALFRAGSAYRLEIADDGAGAALTEGVGMRSIRTRAEALGGTAVWNTQDGTGLCVSIPAGDR